MITSKEMMNVFFCQTTKARSILKMLEMNGLIKKQQQRGGRGVRGIGEVYITQEGFQCTQNGYGISYPGKRQFTRR